MTLTAQPSSAAGIVLSPGSTPWTFTAYSSVVVGASAQYKFLGFTYIFESSGSLTNNVVHEIQFDWALNISGSRTIVASVPVTVMRASGAESQWPEQEIWFPVPVIIPAGGSQTLDVRAATGSAFATTMSGIKAMID